MKRVNKPYHQRKRKRERAEEDPSRPPPPPSPPPPTEPQNELDEETKKCSFKDSDTVSVSVERDGDDVLIVGSGSSETTDVCAGLNRQVSALSAIAQRSGSAPDGAGGAGCESASSGKKRIHISGVAPAIINDWHETKAFRDGPNCFNSALVLSGLAAYLRESSDEELTYYLNSGYCQAVSAKESQAGDTWVIYEGSTPTHAFTYLTRELSFNKIGGDKESPYMLESTGAILSRYGQTLPVREEDKPTPEPDNDADCEAPKDPEEKLEKVRVYRCTSNASGRASMGNALELEFELSESLLFGKYQMGPIHNDPYNTNAAGQQLGTYSSREVRGDSDAGEILRKVRREHYRGIKFRICPAKKSRKHFTTSTARPKEYYSAKRRWD